MFYFATHQRPIPPGVRLAALVFLFVWAVLYWIYWGPTNVLFLCDIAVFLSCIGLLIQSPLLVSSEALAVMLVSLFWTFDVCWHLVFGRTLIGGTEYMFDQSHPLWLRLMSLYHVVLPFVLLWAMNRIGYDRRAFRFQCCVAAIALLGSRAADPSLNINFAYTAPLIRRQVGPAPVHLALTFAGIALVLYLPMHILYQKLFAPPQHSKS